MALRYKKLESGETYNLSDILSEDNRVIIPDLQRDYCWGDKVTSSDSSKTYAYAFIEGLLENLSNDTLNLGLIYGYEAPAGHIQLCDGQQRFTTLFLLIGMINRKTADNAMRSYLISDFEMLDDHEPRLQYAIRESSLYFLSDLTMHFFLDGHNLNVSDIEKQAWFFNDYKLDPSIQSMIKTLSDIEKILDNQNLNPYDTGNLIVSNLTFMYYDMENRRTGEETFVIINTTGEPLSTTENLKAMLFSRQKEGEKDICIDKWETWEHYFWKNRDVRKNDTADNGMAEFFRWVMLLRHHSLQQDNEFAVIQDTGNYTLDLSIPVSLLNEYFEIIVWLFDSKDGIFKNNAQWLSPEEGNHEQIVWFRLLPVVAYVKRFPQKAFMESHDNASMEDYKRAVTRVKNLFNSLSKIGNVQRAIKVLLPNAITLIQRMPSDDILSSLMIEEGISSMILSDEIRSKFSIYRDSIINREEIEDTFWEAEENKVWNGEIMPIIKWSTDDHNNFNYESFKEYLRVFNALFHDDMKYNELDITRRALLAFNIEDYPRIFNGYTNYSFASEFSHWHELIFTNVSLFRKFFDKMVGFTNIDDIMNRQMSIINMYPKDKEFADFVHYPELLGYCEEKNIQYWWETWFLMKQKRWSGEHANIKAYKYYLKLKSDEATDGWILNFWHRDETCVCYEQVSDKESFVAFDMTWNTGERHNKMRIDLYMKPENRLTPEYVQTSLLKIAETLSYKWENNHYSIMIDMPDNDCDSYQLMDQYRNVLLRTISEYNL